MSESQKQPALDRGSFYCPHCKAFSHHSWHFADGEGMGGSRLPGMKAAFCDHCTNYSIWLGPVMVYPRASNAPLPNPDMPADVRADYQEAASILSTSPRGAAALLRLAIQKLCIHLDLPGKDLNTDIAELVKQGLRPQIQKALDTVRVIGNNAVHPGQIDLNDNPEIAGRLFDIVNFITDSMITQPKKIDEMFNQLPPTARAQIGERDARSPPRI